MHCDICKKDFPLLALRYHKMIDKIVDYQYEEWDLYICHECDNKISVEVRKLIRGEEMLKKYGNPNLIIKENL
jgi:hypothetical protein